MKKISFILLSAVVLFGTSCMKDNGFDDQTYGIKDPAASKDAVGFNLEGGVNYKKNVGLVVSDQPQVIDENKLMIGFYSEAPATRDIKVQVALDPSIIDDYNTAYGTSIIELDPASYSIASTTVTIPAGKQRAAVVVTVPSTTALDPNNSYGLAFKVISVDGDVQIAANMSKVMLEINIKNIYDGDYVSNGYFYHPSAPRPIIDRPKTLSTVNATSVALELGDLGGAGYFAIFDVDPATNAVSILQYPNSVPIVNFGTGLPTAGPAYSPQWPRSAECNNVYDPAAEEFKVRYGYVGATGYRVTEECIQRQ